MCSNREELHISGQSSSAYIMHITQEMRIVVPQVHLLLQIAAWKCGCSSPDSSKTAPYKEVSLAWQQHSPCTDHQLKQLKQESFYSLEVCSIQATANCRADPWHQEGCHSLRVLTEDIERLLVSQGGPLKEQGCEHHAW